MAVGVGKDVRMAADQLGGDGLDHVAEIEGALLLRHAGVKDDLEQQVAEFVLEVVEIAAGDGVGDLVGFLERVGRDGSEGLLEVPGAAAAGRAQRRHDLDQPGNVAGRLHGRGLIAAEKPTVAKAALSRDQRSLIRIRHIMEYY